MTTINLDESLKQAEFGRLVGISQQAVSDLLSRGVLQPGQPGREWLTAYCGHLREVAAGRQGEEETGFDLVAERARLASEQADKVAMQNAVTRRELAPVHVIEDVLTRAGSKVAGILESIPGAIRRRVPSLKAGEIELIEREIAKARNIAAAVSLADLGAEAFAVKEGDVKDE